MSRSGVVAGVLAACTAAALVATAAYAKTEGGGAATATPGVTSTSVSIGGTFPLSGEAAAAATIPKGMTAYFKYVNARGGVNGRKINFKYIDDGYDTSRAIDGTRELVQQDKVFAIFGSLGTAQNLATRPFLNTLQVPQLFVSTGASTWGRDYKRFPWTIGFIPSYPAEAKILARYVLKTNPKARIAVLYQNDDYGRDIYNGFRRALGAKVGKIVAKQGYDPTSPDVRSEVAKLKSSKANTFMIFAFGKFAIQAYVFANQLGWRPKVYVNAVASSYSVMSIVNQATKRLAEGSISIVFAKDPSGPGIASDLGYRLYKQILQRYDKSVNVTDGYAMYGMAAAFTMVDALKKAGKNLTRPGIMRAATSLNERNNPFLLPGIVVKTSAKDHFPISQARLQRWHNGRWEQFGGLVNAG